MSERLISVVIPAYNASCWIAETIGSVLAQTYRRKEIIVVDDDSTDDTPAIVRSFRGVTYLRKENGGEGSARNVGISESSGEYVAFLDSDDLWHPEKLSLQYDLLSASGLAWCYSDALAFDGDTGRILHPMSRIQRPRSGDVLVRLFLGDFIPCPTPLIRKTVFEDVGLFDESPELLMRADWDLWLRIAAKHKVGFIDKPLAYYRVHPGSGSNAEQLSTAFKSQLRVLEKALEREPARLQPHKKRAIARLAIGLGRLYFKSGEFSEARRMFSEAMSLAPFELQGAAGWLLCVSGSNPVSGAALRAREWWRRR